MGARTIDYFILCSNNRRMDKLGAMKTFVRIVETGSLTAAAATHLSRRGAGAG
jgi:hypothetical protein